MNIELEDLVGLHFLSGVEFENCDGAEIVRFCIDGITYEAKEDENDGYRSMLDEMTVSNKEVKNTFPETQVVCVMRQYSYREWEILDFVDVHSGKIVLSLGTDNVDDYYPCFISEFNPQNFHFNGTYINE